MRSDMNGMYIVGTCMEMCPRKERGMREREGLLHKFEQERLLESGDFSGGNSGRGSGPRGRRILPRADVNKTIKSFARSAAGLDKTVPEDLRPPQILKTTVAYLCHEVLTLGNEPFNVIYDFVFDRLRSVRQDLVIQRIQDESAISILEVVVRFHLYAAYRLGDEPVEKFDPHINRKHMIDCLKKLIFLYELNNYWKSSRNVFESLYLILAPESTEVILRALSIKPTLNDPMLNAAIQVCFAYQSRNFVKYFRLQSEFSPLIASYFTQQSRYMRCLAYQVITQAYGVSTSKVPVKAIAKILRYPSVHEALNDLRTVQAQICVDDGEDAVSYARFKKSNSALCANKMQQLSNDIGGIKLEQLDSKNILCVASNLICPSFRNPQS